MRITFLALAALALVGCAGTPTELVFAVTQELDVPAEIDRLRIEVTLENGIKRDYTVALTGDDAVALPYEISLVESRDREVPVGCVVEGRLGDQVRVSNRAIVTFVSKLRAQWAMPLTRSCLDVSCTDGQTCRQGACVSAEVPMSELDIVGQQEMR